VPFTGQYSWVGQYVMEAATPMVQQINASGGIFGRDIKLIKGDTEGTVDAGVLAARKLADTDQVLAFIGPTSLSFTGVRQVITDSKIPMISPTAGTTELDTAAKSLIFRTVPSDSLGGRAIAVALSDPSKYLGSSTKYSKIALMVGNAPALVSFEKPIQQSLKDNGLDLVGTSEYTTGQQSYRSEVTKVLGENPDMIILIGEPADSAKIMQQAHQNGYSGGWFVTQDQTNSDYVKLATPAVVNGIYGLQEADPASAADLRKQFEKELGEKDLQIFQSNTYDAVNVLALAMYAAQKQDGSITRATIEKHIDEVANPAPGDEVVTSFAAGKKAMDQGKGIDYQGLAGPVDFDAYGNITSPFDIMQVRDGTFAVAGTVTGQDLK
jgi:neutral amino acid transport system substrate-binding protein